MDWYDRMGWDVAGFGALDCGWLEDGRGLLGAAVIVGLERVKPVSVVSQRAFLLLYILSLDVLPSYGCSVGCAPSNERGVSSSRGRRWGP